MEIPTIAYGAHEETRLLDDQGSVVTTIRDYKDGKVKMPVRHKFTFRIRVHSDAEAKQKYDEFALKLTESPEILNPSWLPKERSKDGDANGYYYVVKSYTVLEY